jgi:hypothetical protein
MGRFLYEIETLTGKSLGSAYTIADARALAKFHAPNSVILRVGRGGRVTAVPIEPEPKRRST